jgi:hypothetical protein
VSADQPAIYSYNQEYEVPGQPGVRKVRRGFIALLRLEDYSARVVHRHEETLSGPRLRMNTALGTPPGGLRTHKSSPP